MLFGSDKRQDRKYSKLSKKDDALVKKLDALNWDYSRKSNRLYKKHNKTLQKLEKNRTWHLRKESMAGIFPMTTEQYRSFLSRQNPAKAPHWILPLIPDVATSRLICFADKR